jgi:uridylate kinase
LALLLALSGEAVAQQSGKAFLWDGTHWQQITQEAKAAYVFGLGNLADFEMAAGGAEKRPCVSKAFADELKAKTVMQIVQAVDSYYKENPNKLNTSVIEAVLRKCTTVCPPEKPAGGQKK